METRNFADVIRQQIKDDPRLARALRRQRFNADVAQLVYDCREERAWSKKKLAKLVGLKKADINNIEAVNYKLTLPLLRKLAEVFGVQLKLTFEEREV